MSNDLDTMKPVIAGAVGNPASTCAQSCEGNAYRIEIRRLEANYESARKAGIDLAKQARKAEQERDALAAKLAELEGQEPIGVVTFPIHRKAPDVDWANNRTISKGMPLYARPLPAEPINARLLEALKACHDQFKHYVGHHLDKGDLDKAAQNERFVALAGAAIASVEAQGVTGPKRLTDEEICQIAANSRSVEVERFLPVQFARAIEAAVLGAQETKSGD